jgi:membrane fusion protein (multidrug efflux system)
MKIKVLQISSLAIGCSLLVGLSSCGGKQEVPQAGAPEIAVLTVTTGNSELSSSYPTIIKGKTDIDVRPQVSGYITKVHVDEGQHVKKGQVLFTIDQVQFQAAVDQATAAVNSARTAVSTAKLTEENKRHLYEKNIISEFDWQIAANQLNQAKAQLSQAEAALTTARKNLAYTVVTAPCDGVVGSIPNREGSLASPSGQALTTVSDNTEVYAYFSLTEKDILKLTNGGAISLNDGIKNMPAVQLQLADGTMYSEAGKVATVSGVIDNTTGSASVRALFSNPNGMLRSGNTGSIVIPVVSENVITIPQKATFELQDLRYVYTVNDSNKAVSTKITVLAQNDGQNFVVTSGLKAGDRVVIEGVGTKVSEGAVITPVEQKAQPAQAEEAQASEATQE